MTFVKKNIETHFAYTCWHFNNARNKRIRNYWFCIRKKKLKNKITHAYMYITVRMPLT